MRKISEITVYPESGYKIKCVIQKDSEGKITSYTVSQSGEYLVFDPDQFKDFIDFLVGVQNEEK